MNLNKLACTALAAGALALSAASAHAGLMTLQVSDGTTSVSFTDSGSGQLVAFAPMGGWVFNVEIALSNAPNANGNPGLKFITDSMYTGTGSSTLTFSLLAQGFEAPLGASDFLSHFDGTTASGGSFTAATSLNSVTQWSTGGPVSGPGAGGVGAFAVNNTTQVNPTATYSLGINVTLNQTGAGTNHSGTTVSVPEPATAGLLALSILGLGFLRRRTAVAEAA